MKPNLMTKQHVELEAPESTSDGKIWVRKGRARVAPPLSNRTILLISDDTLLDQNLRPLANARGRMVVRVNAPAGAVPSLLVVRPAIVLLDLDLPRQAGWEVADALLQERSCPPMLLLTARCEQFDAKTALRAGSLINKTEEPAHLLELVEETLAMPRETQAECNAIQRVLIRWLKPCGWPVPVTPSYRFWGINE
jgi:FixJ family two-component response regulator